MIIRKRGFLTLLVLTLLLILCAFGTLVPFDEAEKVSLLGYKSLNSLAPISTLLFLAAAVAVQVVRRRFSEEIR